MYHLSLSGHEYTPESWYIFQRQNRKASKGYVFFFFLHHNIQELKDAPSPRDFILLRHFQSSLWSQGTTCRSAEYSEEMNGRWLVSGPSRSWFPLCFNPPVFQLLPSPSQEDVGKLKELYCPLDLNPDFASPEGFPFLGMGEERRLLKHLPNITYWISSHLLGPL